MRITFLTPPDDYSGGLRVVAIYARILQSRGHTVSIVSNARAKPSLREQFRGLRRGRLKEVRQNALPQQGHLAQSGVPVNILERARPIGSDDVPDADVVIATWWETAVWMDALPPSKGIKVHLIQGYEIWGDSKMTDKVNAALRLPNLKIAISHGLKHEIETQLGDLGIFVIANAVDLKQFDAPERKRNSPPRVGFVYAQAPMKGADRCYATIQNMRQRIPQLQVIAFGADAPSPHAPLPRGTEYHQRPAQERLASIYASCDLWLFATRVDSFGLPLLEAMACRTPVVSVLIGAAPMLLAEGAGIIISPGNEADLPAAMANAALNLLMGPVEDWRDMSDRAYLRAHSYSWDDAVDRFETLIKDHNANNGVNKNITST
jgi:glycosyltransferase involved in cell wall biosynthesis